MKRFICFSDLVLFYQIFLYVFSCKYYVRNFIFTFICLNCLIDYSNVAVILCIVIVFGSVCPVEGIIRSKRRCVLEKKQPYSGDEWCSGAESEEEEEKPLTTTQSKASQKRFIS